MLLFFFFFLLCGVNRAYKWYHGSKGQSKVLLTRVSARQRKRASRARKGMKKKQSPPKRRIQQESSSPVEISQEENLIVSHAADPDNLTNSLESPNIINNPSSQRSKKNVREDQHGNSSLTNKPSPVQVSQDPIVNDGVGDANFLSPLRGGGVSKPPENQCVNIDTSAQNLSLDDTLVISQEDSLEHYGDLAKPIPAGPISLQTDREPDHIGASLNVESQASPLFSRRRIQKHASDWRKKMPKSRHFRVGDTLQLAQRLFTSPSTRELAPRYLPEFPKLIEAVIQLTSQANHSKDDAKSSEQVVKNVRNLVRLRSKKKVKKIPAVVQQIKKRASLRQAATYSGMAYGQLQQVIRGRQGQGTKGKLVTEDDKKNIREFFIRSDVTMQMPVKRYSDIFFLRFPKEQVYEMYKNYQVDNAYRLLAMSTLWKYLPTWVKANKHIPNQECLCVYCLNWGLILRALMTALVKGVSRKTVGVFRSTFCPPVVDKAVRETVSPSIPLPKVRRSQLVIKSRTGTQKRYASDSDSVTDDLSPSYLDIQDFSPKCIFGQCTRCKNCIRLKQHLLESNVGLELGRVVVWRQWQNKYKELPSGKVVRTDFVREIITGSLSRLLNILYTKTQLMARHLFHFSRQASQFELCKEKLYPGAVLMVMDFAMNMTHQPYEEPQTGMWHRKQSTIHPVVCFFKCGTCGRHNVKHEIIFITEDKKHDAKAVAVFQAEAVRILKENNVPVQRIIQFTDNCSSQYKCYLSFSLISKEAIPFERHYFGQQHGKGPADAAIGNLKKSVDLAVRSGRADIHRGVDLFMYCFDNLTHPYNRNTCTENVRTFHFIAGIDRSETIEAATIPGTLKIHCVYNTGQDNIVKTRESSCFCRSCFDGKLEECVDEVLLTYDTIMKWNIEGIKGSTAVEMANN